MGQGDENSGGGGTAKPRKSPQSAAELLERYAAGERDFQGASLDRADLRDTDLSGADLSGARLWCAYLFGANVKGANLAGANLFGANLTGANLTDADLTSADLTDADLNSANLSGADLSDAGLSGADLSGADLSGADLSGADLSGADPYKANLRGANLSRVNLYKANLRGANLSKANLSMAKLAFADLSCADLSEVNLAGAYLGGAKLSEANLSGADLSGAHFHGANLSGVYLAVANLRRADLSRATLNGASLAYAHLVELDVTPLCDAHPPVVHEAPSTIDYATVLLSRRSPKLKDFLVRTGMPELLVEYTIDAVSALDRSVFLMQSTFISYGAPDEPFARKLYEALHRNGVTTFFFPEHAEPGEKLHRMMRKGVTEHDRMILICSRESLIRKGVLNELEEILAREARDGGASYLIPIRLDDYVFTGWKPPNADVAQAVRDRVVADFEGADKDEAKFQAGLQQLIRALRKKKTVEIGDLGKAPAPEGGPKGEG